MAASKSVGPLKHDIRIRGGSSSSLAHVDGDDGSGMDEGPDSLRGFSIGQAEGIGRGDHDQAGVGEQPCHFAIAASHLRRLSSFIFAEIGIESAAEIFSVQ